MTPAPLNQPETKMTTTPNPVDVHVGAKVRARRKELGLSQGDLATTLGLTFQQVQKYERGSNRISASKLFESSRLLQVPPAYFFDGLPDDLGAETNEDQQRRVASLDHEAMALAVNISRLPAQARQAISNVVRVIEAAA